MFLSPIALFVYNRPEHTRRTILALQKNELATESDLIIFSDGAKNEAVKNEVEEVRRYLKTVTGFKSVKIFERQENQGLAKSIICGVTEVVNQYGKIIVLEDDLVTSPYFLKYMNEALDLYEKEEKVISIHGYIYPIKQELPETFFLKGADCWGWATWKRGWQLFENNGQKLLTELKEKKLTREFDFDGSYPYTLMLEGQIRGFNNSWAVLWYASAFLKSKLTLYPGTSLVTNVGFDDSGTHTGKTTNFNVKIADRPLSVDEINLLENKEARKAIRKYFNSWRLKVIIVFIELKYFFKVFKNYVK
jgi:hypothetical protein